MVNNDYADLIRKGICGVGVCDEYSGQCKYTDEASELVERLTVALESDDQRIAELEEWCNILNSDAMVDRKTIADLEAEVTRLKADRELDDLEIASNQHEVARLKKEKVFEELEVSKLTAQLINASVRELRLKKIEAAAIDMADAIQTYLNYPVGSGNLHETRAKFFSVLNTKVEP